MKLMSAANFVSKQCTNLLIQVEGGTVNPTKVENLTTSLEVIGKKGNVQNSLHLGTIPRLPPGMMLP